MTRIKLAPTRWAAEDFLRVMFYSTIESRLDPRSKKSREFAEDNLGGAYVNCYISFKDQEAAEV